MLEVSLVESNASEEEMDRLASEYANKLEKENPKGWKRCWRCGVVIHVSSTKCTYCGAMQ